MTPLPATRKLPVSKVVAEAFRFPWAHRGAFAKGLAVPAAAIVAIQVGKYLAEEQLTQAVGWAVWVASGMLWVLFAITCHRLVLLELRSTDVHVIPGWGLRETWFVGWLVLVTLIILAIVWVILTVVGAVIGTISHEFFEVTVNPMAKVIGTYFFARMALVFPATAIDTRTSLLKAWRQTRGNGWRMVVIVGVLPGAFNYLASVIFGDEPGVARAVMVSALATVVLAIEIALLSLSYREMSVEGAGP
jgi:hypothetical protein